MSQQPFTRRRCRRCVAVPVQWCDLTRTARLIVASVQLRRDVDLPAVPAVADELWSYYRHVPHTAVPFDALDQRARRYLADGA